MEIRRILTNRRGSALVLGLGVMLLLGLLTSALLPWITAEARFGRNERDGVQARYAAEAGVKRALATFTQATPSWGWLEDAIAITNTAGQGTYNVTICKKQTISPFACVNTTTPSGSGDYTITSTGTANGMTKVSKLGASFTAGGGGYATYAGGALEVKNNTTVVEGLMGYGWSYDSGKSVDCPSPQANDSCVIKATMMVPTYNKSDYSGSPSPPAPSATLTETKYYRNGSWTLGNNGTWTGAANTTTVIFVNGDVSFDNNITINAGANGAVLLYVTGNVDFKNNATLKGAAVIARGNIEFKNSADIEGFVMAAGALSFKNNATLDFDSTAAALLGLTTYTGSVVAKVTPGNWEKSTP